MGLERPELTPGSQHEHALGIKGQRIKSKTQYWGELEIKTISSNPRIESSGGARWRKEEESKVRRNGDRF